MSAMSKQSKLTFLLNAAGFNIYTGPSATYKDKDGRKYKDMGFYLDDINSFYMEWYAVPFISEYNTVKQAIKDYYKKNKCVVS